MVTVSIREARTQLSKYIDRARGGEEIVILKPGSPYAKLVQLAGSVDPVARPSV